MPERRLRPGARRALIAVVGLATAGGAAYGATFTSIFAADEVRVEGAVRIAPGDLRRIAGVHVGANVFHLDARTAEARLDRDPRIAEASVRADLPDVVTIRVVERIPVGRAEVEGTPVVVADDGAVLPGRPRESLPEIRPVAGSLDHARRIEAASILGSFAPAVRREVVTVFATTVGTFVLETGGGVTVTYGRAHELTAKAQAVRAVLDWARSEDVPVIEIDVTVPSHPAARTLEGSVTPS